MTFTARQVLTAAQLNDLSIDTLTTTGNVTVGGDLSVTGSYLYPAGLDGNIVFASGGEFASSTALSWNRNETTPIVTLQGTDSGYAEFRAHGSSQGTGAMYVGQSDDYGGGMFYNGDGSPAYATGESSDRTSFFRRSGGTNQVVFSYPYDSNTVTFRGTVDAAGGLAVTGSTTLAATAGPQLIIKDSNTADASGYIAFQDNAGTQLGYIGYGNNDDIHIKNENVGGNIFFNTQNTWRAYFDTNGHFLPYVANSYTLGSASLRWGYLYAQSVNCSGLIDVNWVRNTNGNYLALEGGDAWDLGNNASGEYVWLAAESGLMLVSSDANSTVWANRNQVRITPEGGIDQRLRIHGGLEVEGPDGGGVIRYWQAGPTYVMFGTAGMASEEYAVLTDGINTFISCGSGGTVHIRGPNNDSSPQITNNGTNVSITGTCLFTDIDISGTARANEFRADDYGPADDASFTFISDEDTGVYRVTTNQLGLAAGGSAGIVVASGTCITAAPATSSTSGYQYVLRNNTFGTLYRFTSSADLKENIVTFDDSGDIIDALRPVTFVPRFIPGQPTPDDQDDEYDPTVETDAQRVMREADIQHGFIAEEIALVAGGTLAQYEWTDDGELKPTGWRWPDLISVLTAEVKALRRRVEALESAP